MSVIMMITMMILIKTSLAMVILKKKKKRKIVSNNIVSFAFQIYKDEKDCQNFVYQGHYEELRALNTVHGGEM